jgi:hypothetical protein
VKIVVTTCPAYAHLLEDFDYLFQRFWGAEYLVIGRDKQQGWSNQIIDELGKLDDEYIILLHEDFYITEKVDTNRIEQLLKQMKEQGAKRTSLQCIEDGYEGYVGKEVYPGVHIVKKGWEYICSFEASIWHRETLIHTVLKRGENAHQAEVLGSRRNPRMKALVPATTVLTYSDARIHGEERMKVINGTFHKNIGPWVDLKIPREES